MPSAYFCFVRQELLKRKKTTLTYILILLKGFVNDGLEFIDIVVQHVHMNGCVCVCFAYCLAAKQFNSQDYNIAIQSFCSQSGSISTISVDCWKGCETHTWVLWWHSISRKLFKRLSRELKTLQKQVTCNKCTICGKKAHRAAHISFFAQIYNQE